MPASTRQGSHELVLDALGRRIAAGDIAAGTVLTLAALEAEYKASRTVIREAVRVLEAHGMVKSRRRVGITVQARASWNALDSAIISWTLAGPHRDAELVAIMELRSAVEPTAAALAAEHATPEDRARLLELGTELDRLGRRGLGDSDEYLAVDIAFHDLLLSAGGNLLLAQLSGPIRAILTGRVDYHLMPANPREGTLEHHLKTALAVAAGDVDLAEESARGYVRIITSEIRGD